MNLGDLQSRIVEQEENVSLKHLIFWDLPSTVAKLEREVSYQRYRLQERSLSKRLEHIFLDNVTTSLPFIMTPVAVNMEKTKRWLERQVMPSLLMIKEIEKKTGANYLEEIDRHTRLTEKQELKIKQMTTDIADMIEKDTAVPQGNDGIF